METKTELLLLQRTMVVVEGVARSLDPNLNMWETSRPVVEKYIAENLGPKAFLNDLGKLLRIAAKLGPHLPQIADDFIKDTRKSREKKPLNSFFSGFNILSIVSILLLILACMFSLFFLLVKN